MRLRDHLPATLALLSVGLAMALSAGAGPAPAAEPAYRYRALIEVQRPGAFVQLPLPASIYGHAQQPGLADLRIVDARGERVPFAFLPPPAQPTPAARDATLYALPRQRTASGDWALPVTVQVQGREIRVVTPTGTPVNPPAPAQPPGWLIDLGAPHAEASAASSTAEPQPRALVLAWSGPADFSAGYDLQTSADLRHWAGADSGQLMALTAPTGPLTQPQVPLPAEPARFVRLLWHDPATAPQLTAARLVYAPLAAPGPAAPPAITPPGAAQDAPTWLAFPASPPPQDAVASPPRAIHFDLGGPVPITLVALDTGPGTRILPLQIDGRAAAGQPWQPLVQGVAYRLERDGQVSQSPPLAITTALRYLRVVPDERAAAPPRDALRLRVQTHLPRLVLPTQGQPPYTLLAGAPQAPPGALPISALVPALQDERPRLGQATLGPWTEEPTVARDIAAAQQRAAWRPWVLWGVLLAGVAGLGVMVWRLRRGV